MIHKGGTIEHMTPHRLNQNHSNPIPYQLILRGSQTPYNRKHDYHDSCTLHKGNTIYPRVVFYRNLLFTILTLPLVYDPDITTCHYKGLLWVICQALLR
jgi:hypothetical protein